MKMNDAIKTHKRGNYVLSIVRDEDPSSPLEWAVCTMRCAHRRYKLGTEQFNSSEYDGWEAFDAAIEEEKPVFTAPLSMTDHGGICAFGIGDRRDWDSGRVGSAFITDEALKSALGMERYNALSVEERVKHAEAIVRAEVEQYEKYLLGECYGYRVEFLEECNLGHTHEETVDSCYGFLDEKDAEREGMEALHHFVALDTKSVTL
jgi:hypothetical protein